MSKTIRGQNLIVNLMSAASLGYQISQQMPAAANTAVDGARPDAGMFGSHARGRPESGRVIYIGGFVDEAILAERGLRTLNAACSNRMDRISQALRAGGYRPVILSPAASLRMKSAGVFFHPARLRRRKSVPAIFAPVLNLFGLNVLSSFVFQFLCLRTLLRSHKVCGVVIYNFNPSLVLLCAYLRWVWRLPVLNNIEDVSVPSLKDWNPRTEARPVQQIIFAICMKLIARMSDAYIVPTRRFLAYLPVNKPAAVVTGCIAATGAKPGAPMKGCESLHVLFAGKIEREHGIVEFIRALQQLDAMKNPPSLRASISGEGHMAGWVRQEVKALRNIKATFHGFVSSSDYAKLLNDSHVCVALQNPEGRYADFKTPSKVYEFLGHGKAVISTVVGDIGELPSSAILLIEKLESRALAERLLWLCAAPERPASLQFEARHLAEKKFSYAAVGAVLKTLFQEVGGAEK